MFMLNQNKYTARRSEIKRKNTQKIIRRSFGFIIILGLFSGIFYLLFFCKFFRIKNISVKSSGAAVEAEVLEAAKEVLGRKVFNILPLDSLALFNKDKISKEISESCALKSISINRKFPSSLEIQTEERKGIINWCDADDCHLIGEDGEIASKDLNPDFAMVSENCSDESKKRNKEKAAFILKANELIANKLDIKIKSFSLESCFTQKLAAKTDAGFEVYFNLSRPVDEQENVLYNVLIEKISKKDWGKLEYIDLQVEGKVYYK